jgi:hypothetical protein
MKAAEILALPMVVLAIGIAPPAAQRAEARTAAAACTSLVATHTDANFSGGSYVTQAGFQQSEIAAASYPLTAGSFPLRLDTLELVFMTQGSTVTTTTRWTALVYRGLPSTGTLLASFSSNGGSIPHLVLPPGTTGHVVRQVIDPSSPVVIADDGSHTFSIGFRVDAHNSPPADSCSDSPPTTSNAFPTTDASGLSHAADNWIRGVNCGPFGCPANGGWARFSQLPAYCRPSGDWVMRAVYRPAFVATETAPGACSDGLDNDCDGNVDCADSDCAADSACAPVAVEPPAAIRDEGPRLAVTNPFVIGRGRMSFTLPSAARVRVDLVDVAGKLVTRLADDDFAPGFHEVEWNGRGRVGSEIPPGILFVRLTDDRGHWVVRRMVLIR